MRPCSIMAWVSLALSAQVQAVDEEPAMTFDGMLDIRGSLHHAPCILEMSSAYQTVDLGNVPRSYLQRPGDMAPPVAFQLRFMECRRIAGGCPMPAPPHWSGAPMSRCCPWHLSRPPTRTIQHSCR